MPLPATPAADDWAAEIASAAREEFNCSISLSAPGTAGTRNPSTGVIEGRVAGATVLTQRPARIQHKTTEAVRPDGNGITVIHSVIVQCEILADDPIITKGLVLNVHDPGRDPSLLEYHFRTYSGLNSGHAAVRTIRARTEVPG